MAVPWQVCLAAPLFAFVIVSVQPFVSFDRLPLSGGEWECVACVQLEYRRDLSQHIVVSVSTLASDVRVDPLRH